MKQFFTILALFISITAFSQDIQIVGDSYNGWQLGATNDNDMYLLNKKGTILMHYDSLHVSVSLLKDVIQNDTTFAEADKMMFFRLLESSTGDKSTPGSAIRSFSGFPKSAAILLLVCERQVSTIYSSKEIKKLKKQ